MDQSTPESESLHNSRFQLVITDMTNKDMRELVEKITAGRDAIMDRGGFHDPALEFLQERGLFPVLEDLFSIDLGASSQKVRITVEQVGQTGDVLESRQAEVSISREEDGSMSLGVLQRGTP